MTTTTKKSGPVTMMGEEVGFELGQRFVIDFQLAHPNETPYYMVGREIIEQILAQPGCAGVKFYRALNEQGQDTLVYVGMNSRGSNIFEIVSINVEGELEKSKGIVADRSPVPLPKPVGKPSGLMSPDDFEWTID